MAVYTRVSDAELTSFLGNYALGAPASITGIAEGVENSNFLLLTPAGRHILTIFEKRVASAELPWFMGLMTHLGGQGFRCPLPVSGRDGDPLQNIAGKKASITTFLPGHPVTEPTEAACFAVGRVLAQMHLAAQGFEPTRQNSVGPQDWANILEVTRKALMASPNHGVPLQLMLDEAIDSTAHLRSCWPKTDTLPVGQIHADLFPDNVFFEGEEVSGVIDFYFACTDFLAYDLAIALNAWCLTDDGLPSGDTCQAMIAGYQSVRKLTDAEWVMLPLFAQGAALRFLATRLHDWILTPLDALVTRKDPQPYLRRMHYWKANGLEVMG